MLKQILVAIVLFSIIFISGCTIPELPGGVGGKYCSAVGLCQVEEKEVEVPDIIVVKEVKIIPMAENRVSPDSEIDIIVTLENRDADKPVDLEYVGISNPSIFECIDCKKTGTINPGQIKTFEFKVKSPKNTGTMALPGHLEFSVKYEYTSTRLTTITFIDRETYIEYLNSDGKVETQIINVPSDGPVELYLDISKIQQPVITNDENNYQVYLEVRNKGNGEIDIIDKPKLKIDFTDMNLGNCSKEFDCSGSSAENNEPIILRGKKSFRYYFSFNPTVKLKSEEITTVRRIDAEATYIYRLPKTIDILVSPRAEI